MNVGNKHNSPPDVELSLTHEQATFLLRNMLANKRLCFGMIMSLADEPISQKERQRRATPINDMDQRFGEIMRLLRKAGAREPEDE